MNEEQKNKLRDQLKDALYDNSAFHDLAVIKVRSRWSTEDLKLMESDDDGDDLYQKFCQEVYDEIYVVVRELYN